MNLRHLIVFMILAVSALSMNANAKIQELPLYKKFDSTPSPKTNNPKEIIFIHGMFMTPLCWENWVKSFAEEGYAVSAPAWPLHDGSVEELRQSSHLAPLGKLTFDQVLNHYRKILRQKATKPILVGHSLGGLIAQILLSEGLGQAAIAIDSAPPFGIFVTNASFLRANAGIFNFFANPDSPIQKSLESFSYSFLNAQPQEERRQVYERFYIPESRHVGRGPLTKSAAIDFTRPRGPLLMIAGSLDRIIPPELNYKNFMHYKNTPGMTEFVLMSGRDHSTITSPGAENVIKASQEWLDQQFLN